MMAASTDIDQHQAPDQGIQDFLTWHTLRVKRKTGKPPAASTLASKRSRISTASGAFGSLLHQPSNNAPSPLCSESLRALGTALGDREQVETLLDVLSLRLSSGALRNTFDALQDFGGYAVAKGWAAQVALLKSDRPSANPQQPITVYSEDEVKLILDTARARGVRFWMLVETLAGTGRRIGEVLGLEWARLNLDADPPHFDLPTTKTGRQQYVPLSKHLATEVFTPENIARLRTEPQASNRAFARNPAVYPFPWTYTAVWKHFERHCRAIGVESRSFHCFRHTFITNMLAKGVPLQAVSMLAGHSNTQTTFNRYHHASTLAYAGYLDA